MLAGLLFMLWRAFELITLIPLIGMLSYFVNGYVNANQLTPDFILVLFIVSVLAGVWALATVFFYYSAKRSGYLLAFMDLGIFGALIAGVVELGGIATADCNNFPANGSFGIQLGPFIYELGKSCNMLKACFAFGIMNILFFFTTFILALFVHHHERRKERKSHRSERTYTSRRSSHRRSGSRGGQSSRDGYDDRRRSGGRSNYGGDSRRSYV